MFGDEAAEAMVDWMHRVESGRAELRELNDLNFARIVALCDKRDQYHSRAVKHLKHLTVPGGDPFGICEAVVAEACVHLPHAQQRLRLRGLLDEVRATPPSTTFDGTYRDEVFAWLEDYAEHEPDWADACLAVLSGRDRSASLWTYDREFRTTWRRPDGSRIPLAVSP